MGTVTEESKHGHIYLQQDVSGQFDKVLATSQHGSVDTFLEHLFELYTKASKTTQTVAVRNDVAQRFTALQCETRFQTSDDLMKHLLFLHVQYLKTASNDTAKQTRERSVPRKRKSQPKRNFKHTALIDSEEESEEHLTSSCYEKPWRELSVSSVEEAEASLVEGGEVDLSRVKQEVFEADDVTKNRTSGKDADREAVPLCLTLGKQTLARGGVANIGNIPRYVLGNHNSIDYKPKTTRPFAQSNWRSTSEPVSRENAFVRAKQEPKAVQVNPQVGEIGGFEATLSEAVDTTDNKFFNDSPPADDDRLGYNYVLNSLATSPGPDGHRSNSLPSSPMQMPLKYPKSISYTISSDEDEPQDLSLTTNIDTEQPHNLSISKLQMFDKDQNHLVKYDSNANAVPIAQFANGQFISPSQIAIPQNLLYHDPCTTTNLVGQPQVLQIAQAKHHAPLAQMVSTNGIQTMVGNPPSLFVAGMPLLNVCGPPPLTSPVLIRPKSNLNFINAPPQMLVPISPVLSPTSSTRQQVMVTSPNSGGQSSDAGSPQHMRRKRKRLEDTTVFRDPQEASLPFNGPNKYRFYCDVCDTGFTRKYTFNRHKCKGRVEKHYCQMCDKAYLSKYKLKDHILVKHEGQTVSCPECGKRFSSRSSMEMHKKQQHEGMYSIFCKICNKGFNHTGHYYGHMNKHTNTKPFWCQQCGKRFFGSSYLHNHKQVCRGNNELNYACTVCDRKFKCELYLKKHMKIHDNIPLIANPNFAKAIDEDLTEAGVQIADISILNGAVYPEAEQSVFPNGPDTSDSNSNSNSGALVIDDEVNKMEMDSFENEAPAVSGSQTKQAVVA